MSGLHVVTLGESPSATRRRSSGSIHENPDSSRPRSSIKIIEDKTKDAMPKPSGAAINRYKANVSSREKNEQKHQSFSKKDDNKAPSTSIILDTTATYNTPTSNVNNTDHFKPKARPASANMYSTHSSGLPTGAHTSGFYTKLRQEQVKQATIKTSITITDMLNDINIPKGSKNEENSFVFDVRRASLPAPSTNRDSNATGVVIVDSWFPEPDLEAVEKQLAILTDIDATMYKLSEALSELNRLSTMETEPSMSAVLYEAGLLSVLMELLPRTTNLAEIQGAACVLLNSVLSKYPPANDEFLSLGGLSVLLKASETASKALLNSKYQTSSGRKASVHHITTALSRKQSQTSEMAAQIVIEEPSREDLTKSDGELDNALHTLPLTHTSLTTGFLSKYYAPDYLEKLDGMSTMERKENFQYLLSFFEKVDRLLHINSGISLDANIYSDVEKALQEATSMLHVEQIILYRVDDETKEVMPYGNFSDTQQAPRFPMNQGLVGYSIANRCMINVKNPASYPQFSPEVDCPDLDGDPHSLICVPISSGDNITGVFVGVNKMGPGPDFTPKKFEKEDEYLFKSLSNTAGAMMGNAKIYESMHTTQKKVTVLLETTRSLASILDLDKLIKVIMDSAKELLSSDRCTLFLHDPERKQLRAIIQGRDSVQEIRIPSNAGIAGAAFTSGVPINIQDAYKDSRFNPEVDKQTGYITRTILCMPIKNIHSECIGVTQMINKRSGVYSAEDEMILSSFSSQAAVAIEKSQLFKKTEDMRIYLQSILSSITSCVMTLSESMKLNTINRPWLMNALGVDEQFMKENSVEKWIGEEQNKDLLKDIRQVYKNWESIYVTDFEIKGVNSSVIVNYQVMPLIGSHGVVVVLDDISSEKRAVMTLGRYMSPALAKQVMEEGTGQLGGKRKKVSILFSDIRSFTTLSEGMDPPEVVELLNHHFTDAVNAITEEQGDAVMAVFGVPFSKDEDAIHACNTALKMRDALVITNRDREAQGKKTIKMGIGVNTGMVLSGNIGSLKRMEFSCIGDAVNLASRTEGLTKYYGITILITQFTLDEAGDSFITREIESVVVTGKKMSVKMYELLGRKGDILSPELTETIRLFQGGLAFYKRRMFIQAQELFESAIQLTDDGPSKVLLSRCKHYIEQPPPVDWDGTYVAEGK
ncbi:hypothetical protein HDV04_004854 [Boothiomyces sp. JEL0838]|nr:hypothetical protein HDV04_004854 [Boothiomyces sp. JEL0838]